MSAPEHNPYQCASPAPEHQRDRPDFTKRWKAGKLPQRLSIDRDAEREKGDNHRCGLPMLNHGKNILAMIVSQPMTSEARMQSSGIPITISRNMTGSDIGSIRMVAGIEQDGSKIRRVIDHDAERGASIFRLFDGLGGFPAEYSHGCLSIKMAQFTTSTA